MLSKNRPLVETFGGLHHESAVVMPFKYKHHFWIPKKYLWGLNDKYTHQSTEVTLKLQWMNEGACLWLVYLSAKID